VGEWSRVRARIGSRKPERYPNLTSIRATYAEMQRAFAHVYASVGLDAFDGRTSGDERVSDFASSLEAIWRKRGEKS